MIRKNAYHGTDTKRSYANMQLTPLIMLKCTSDFLAKMLASVFFCTIFTVKYYVCHLKIKSIKNYMMDPLYYIFNNLKDENEINIIKKYHCIAKRYAVVFTAIIVCVVPACIVAHFLYISNSNVPIKAFEPQRFIMVVYFINKKKYFYLILLHVYAIFCIMLIIIVGTGTMLITYFQYTCGIFRIASYRIEHAVIIEIHRQNIALKNNSLMTEGLICAINIHRQAMKLSNNFLFIFGKVSFLLTACCVVCISLNLFQLFQVVLSKNNFFEFISPLMCVSIIIFYIFIANTIGQNIIEHNTHIFDTAYNIQWYRTSLHMQRMILFLLQRRSKKLTLNIGGVFDASLEGFAMLVKASISYFTVMYSVQ